MWLAKYLPLLGLREIGRGRVGHLEAADEAGGAPQERAFRGQGLPRLEAGRPGGRTLAVRGFLLVRARVDSRLAARATSSSASSLQPRQQLGVRLFQAGDLAPRTARPGCGVPCRRAVVQGQYRHPVRFLCLRDDLTVQQASPFGS